MSPVGTQNITFRLYRDTGAGCTPANLVASVPGFTNPHTKAVTLNGAGTGSVTSDAFTPTAVGTYRWVATYEGDVNNASVTGVCTDVTERTIVSQATPSILTDASDDQQLGGGSLTDIATVSGVVSPVGTQNITFRLYRDTGAGCTPANLVASVPGFTNPHTKPVLLVGGSGSVTSDAFTPTAVGTYRWVATYEGDANNASVSGVCTDVTERTIVSQATPSILTDASNDQQLGGGALTDIATVSGVVSPVGTQNITFRLYRDTGAGCTPANLVASVPGFTNPHTKAVTLNGAGTGSVTSDAFTPTAVGTYRWVATYEGDVNNASVTGVCTDVTERTIVSQATPSILTDASNDQQLGGGALTDIATVSGVVSPVGTQNITFRLYRDTGAGCTPANLVASVPGFTNPHTKAVTLNGAGTGSVTSDAFTPTAVGTYRWVATYEGDVNNASVTGVCTDVTERTIVSQATPSILTDASNDQQLGGGVVDGYRDGQSVS